MHGPLLVVGPRKATRAETEPTTALEGAADALLATLTEGARCRLALAEGEAVPFLTDLAAALEALSAGAAGGVSPRATLRLGVVPAPWEMGLLRGGGDVLVSVYHGGATPDVVLFDRRLDLGMVRDRAALALRAYAELGALAARVEALSFGADVEPIEPVIVAVEPTGDVPLVIAAEALLRPPGPPAVTAGGAVQRADLFALLFRGRLRITVGGHARELPEMFLFPLAEQLATLVLEGVEAWTRGRPYYRRVSAFEAVCGVRLATDGAASLTLGVPRGPGEARAQTWTFPAVEVGALGQGVVAFGRALLRTVTRRDRAQSQNLRLYAFRARIRELSERLRDATRDDSKINEAPERYRAFAASMLRAASAGADALAGGPTSRARSRLRFSPRWLAAVPSIDLRSTFLCGERVLVGATRELHCLDAQTGCQLWRQELRARGVSVMTPLGLSRLEPDGSLRLHDLGTGEALWTTRLAPRVGPSASGAVVAAPGLPRLLIVTEGARHLAAIDLHGGEVRWRFSARRGGTFRLRRAGRLVIVASSDPALVALDVLTGEVVWRLCDRLRFASHVAVDHDALFAVAGGGGAIAGRGGTRLHHVDPWSGARRWSVDLPDHMAPVGAPLLGPETVLVATCGRQGTALAGFDRQTGALRFDQAICGSAASCLAVDDTAIINGEGGELVGISTDDGTTRYRHVFTSNEGDRPRRLEPVLRSGALFVPQSEVHVVRPHDGTIIGRVPNDMIPDLLRVGERCDVYVAEESGHLGAYDAGPRLTLVTPL
jgi:outer membrane protein assembly factor BamB